MVVFTVGYSEVLANFNSKNIFNSCLNYFNSQDGGSGVVAAQRTVVTFWASQKLNQNSGDILGCIKQPESPMQPSVPIYRNPPAGVQFPSTALFYNLFYFERLYFLLFKIYLFMNKGDKPWIKY